MADEKDGMNLFDKRAAAQREGGLLMLFSLVEDGTLELSVAAAKAGMEQEAFLRKMNEAGFSAGSAANTGDDAYAEGPAAKTDDNAYTEVPIVNTNDDTYSEVPTESGDPAASVDYSEVPVVIPTEEKKTYGPDDVGLVLSGGGGKGAYQIGVLRALAEEGQLDHVAAVAGTSIGAINAVLYVQGDFEKAYKTWDDIDMGVLFDLDPALLAQGKICFSRDEMNRLMNQYIDYSALAASKYEIYCGVAEETGSGYRAEYMKLNGKSVSEIQNILMASTALPVVYDTVVINGKHYRDGGVVDNEPVRPLYDAGLRKFILVNLDYSRVFHKDQFPGAEFIIIDPSRDLGDIFSGTLNFSKGDKEIKRAIGYKDGKRAIKVLIEKDPAYISMAPALAARDYEETVREYERLQRVAALESSVNSSFDYIAELEKKYQ